MSPLAAAHPAPVFRLLGPVEVVGPGGPVPVPPGRQQAVLALLLLNANQVVGTDHLVDALWDHDPPGTARTQVQICVSRLRKTLSAGGVEVAILTRPPGYLLRVDDELVDARLFSARVARARDLVARGRPVEAVELLRTALDLWRGPALSGIANRALRNQALRLDEERLDAAETAFGLELDLGYHHRVVGVLSRAVHDHPLRERLRAQLMLALHRSGRQAEALEVYRAGRELLVGELGLEPSEHLRALEAAIFADDPSLRLPAGAAEPGDQEQEEAQGEPPASQAASTGRPRQLPADSADFIVDEQVLRTAEEALVGDGNRRAVGIVVVVGAPGTGKSALAAHIGHRVAAEHFPDGQLFCDLRGEPADPATVLGRFLIALGIPGSVVPAGLVERVEMYRTVLADRRVLVVVDDAVAESQVVPLLPGSSTCGVVVTSRSRLTGLPGARRIELDRLSQEHALELLERVAGAERVRREPEAAAALVRAVGALPLAVRIIAARLAARPHWTLAMMVRRLADERHRLDELAHGDMTIRVSLALTHDGLDASLRELFCLLGLAEGPTMPGWVAGAVLDDHRPHPSDLLEPLIDVRMLDVVSVERTGEFRYHFQDIIRLFAREKLAQLDRVERDAALRRLLGGWMAIAERAHRGVYGGDFTVLHGDAPRWCPPEEYLRPLLADPLEWLEGERANLTAAVVQAARAGLDELCWDLAVTSVTLFEARGYLDDWERTHDEALRAMRLSGNTRGTAVLLASLGTLHINRGQPARSHAALSAALRLFEELGEPLGLAVCHRDLALLRRQAGDDEGAVELYDQALGEFDRAGDVVGRAIVLTQRAHVLARHGRLDAAYADLDEALALQRELGYAGGIARTQRRIGQLQAQSGDYAAALETLTGVLEVVRACRDVIGETHLLRNLGEVNEAAGRREQARAYFRQALAVCERIMDGRGAAVVRAELARSLVRDEQYAPAVELLSQAAHTFRDSGMTQQHAAVEQELRLIRSTWSGGS